MSTPNGQPATDLGRWREEARRVSTDAYPSSNRPLPILLHEATSIVRFFAAYFEPQKNLPGLRSVAGENGPITPETGDEIASLVRAVQEAQVAYAMALQPTADTPARGRLLLREIDAALGFLLGGGSATDRERLARLRATSRGGRSRSALASALDSYAGVASHYRRDLDGLGGFDASVIHEAGAVAAALRTEPDRGPRVNDASKRAMALRNRLLRLLTERVDAVRRAARFVFRAHPAIAREATSAYERARRVAWARANAQARKRKGEAKEPQEKTSKPASGGER